MTERPADYSVLLDGRLVAYIWECTDGALRIGADAAAVCALDYADIVAFDRDKGEIIEEIAGKRKDIEALLVSLGVEGFDIRPTEVHPNAHLRRF